MKILITFLGYGENVFAGMERSIYTLTNGLVDEGHQVVIYTSKMHPIVQNKKYKVVYDNNLIDFIDPAIGCVDDQIKTNYKNNQVLIKQKLLKTIKEEKPDYVLVQDHLWGIIPHINIFNEIDCKIGLLFHMTHNPDLIKEMFDYNFDHYFCVSEFVKEEIIKICKPKQKLILLPNCITRDFLIKGPNILEINNFICNARISKEKGVADLLKVWKEFLTLYPNKKLYLTSGEFRFLVKDEISKDIEEINNLYPNSIIILGNLKWSEIVEELKSKDCILVPSKNESFGIAALEGMALGKYVVSTEAGNLKYLFKGITKTYNINDNSGFLNEMINIIQGKSKYKFNKAYKRAINYESRNVAKNFIKEIEK